MCVFLRKLYRIVSINTAQSQIDFTLIVLVNFRSNLINLKVSW